MSDEIEVPLPSTWKHKNTGVTYRIVKLGKFGIYYSDQDLMFSPKYLAKEYEMIEGIVDEYAKQKAWAKKYGYTWKEEGPAAVPPPIEIR